METVELKACPFCGSAAELVGDTTTLIRCTNEECISLPAPYNNYGHRADAITAWNTRFQASLPPSGIAEAVKERCAKVAVNWNRHPETGSPHETSINIAEAIRALDLSDMGGKTSV